MFQNLFGFSPDSAAPSCFGVFLKATGESLLAVSPSATTAVSATQVAAQGGSNIALRLALKARGAASALRAGSAARVALATRANTLFTASEVLGRAVPYLAAFNLIGAELIGIQAETDAALAGQCQ